MSTFLEISSLSMGELSRKRKKTTIRIAKM